MPNEDGIDQAEMQMMTALLQFKKKHGAAAYLALMSKFNVQRWSEIPSTAHGEVTMQCMAGVAGLNIVEEVEDGSPSVQDQLSEIAAKVYGEPKDNSAFATVVNSAPTLKQGFDLAARAIHARPVK